MSAKPESPDPSSPKQFRRKVLRRKSSWAGPSPLGEVLAKSVDTNTQAEADNVPIDMETWRAVVGPRIAERSSPFHLEPDGVLQIRVATSVWAQELSLLSSAIIKRLRALGMRVTFLRFSVGRIQKSLRTTGRVIRRIVAPPIELPADLAADMMHIDDPELREVVMQAAAASLAELARDMRAKKKTAKRVEAPIPPPPPSKRSNPPRRT